MRKRNVFKMFLLVSTSYLISCQNDELKEVNTAETATLKVVKKYLDGDEIFVEDHGDYYQMDNDIKFRKDHLTDSPIQNKSTGLTNLRWPDNLMIYKIADDLPQKERVTLAISHWESRTNMRFKERTNETDYVLFAPGQGCSSFLGKIGGVQRITLSTGCPTGTVIHEIGHAAGIFHEQNRKDRDQYVTINFENIREGFEHNFQTYIQRGRSGAEYTEAFDFGSIMMYGPTFFTKNGRPTITKKDGSTYDINRFELSDLDIEGINKMYPRDGGNVGTEKIRVYAYNPDWYTTAYTWDADNPNPTFWPGDKTTVTRFPTWARLGIATEEVSHWTTIRVNLYNNKQQTNIIFSQDGKNQTKDLIAAKGYPYFYNDNWYVAPPRISEFRDFSLDVLVKGYTHMYTWDEEGNPTSGVWPGRKMEEIIEDGWYLGELFGDKTCTNIIFSNNGQNQTADLYVCEDRSYYYNGAFHKYPPSRR